MKPVKKSNRKKEKEKGSKTRMRKRKRKGTLRKTRLSPFHTKKKREGEREKKEVSRVVANTEEHSAT